MDQSTGFFIYLKLVSAALLSINRATPCRKICPVACCLLQTLLGEHQIGLSKLQLHPVHLS